MSFLRRDPSRNSYVYVYITIRATDTIGNSIYRRFPVLSATTRDCACESPGRDLIGSRVEPAMRRPSPRRAAGIRLEAIPADPDHGCSVWTGDSPARRRHRHPGDRLRLHAVLWRQHQHPVVGGRGGGLLNGHTASTTSISGAAGSDSSIGMIDRHFGNVEQPQNSLPALFPRLATRRAIAEPHFGHGKFAVRSRMGGPERTDIRRSHRRLRTRRVWAAIRNRVCTANGQLASSLASRSQFHWLLRWPWRS